MSSHNHKLNAAGILITLGIIYGDIGTSPLYVVKAIIGEEKITPELIYGGISCIFWTLMIVTTFKYVYLALNADNRGEGGIFALYALVRRYRARWIIIPALIGCAALIADGFITPPISVSSAIEGLKLYKPDLNTVPIVLGIIVGLFSIQQFGTNFIGKSFGPVMLIWFSLIGTLGLIQVLEHPTILQAINPMHAINLIVNYKGELTHIHGFWILGAVFLCTTGGEALYTDLGHCGKENIRVSWIFVVITLLLSYFGQGAYILSNFNGKQFEGVSTFYAHVPSDILPYVIGIATASTIIASQALISGVYTLVNEAMKLKLWPNMKVNYPTQMKGQIYIPSINWFLMFGCISVVLIFREATKMEAAYGLAIILNMIMTTALLLHYMYIKHETITKIITIGVLFFMIEISFLISNMLKFTHGGWFSVMIAAILFFFLYMWFRAKTLRNKHTDIVNIEPYIPMFKDLMNDDTIPKEATNLVYMAMTGNEKQLDSNILYSIFKKRPKRADIYWFVHVDILDDPFLKQYKVTTIVPGKVFFIRLKFGFKVEHKVNRMFSTIVQEMQAKGEVDELSHYPSLRKHNLPADFKFILLNSRVSVDEVISPFNQFVIRVYRILKKLSLPTHEDFGLELSNMEIETVPINIGKAVDIKMQRE